MRERGKCERLESGCVRGHTLTSQTNTRERQARLVEEHAVREDRVESRRERKMHAPMGVTKESRGSGIESNVREVGYGFQERCGRELAAEAGLFSAFQGKRSHVACRWGEEGKFRGGNTGG
jgi:hypothetical protein